jgi:PhoPQ-activated pathogenicity-related protein
MLLPNRIRPGLALYSFATVALIASPALADLESYVSKPEAAFEWQFEKKLDTPNAADHIYDFQFVSQVWQGQTWRHQLQIYQPANTSPGSTMFLWVTGGRASPEASSL